MRKTVARPAPSPLARALVLGIAVLVGGSALPTLAADVQAATQATPVKFDIPAQPLDLAVVKFAEQSGIQVFFDNARLSGLNSQPLSGLHTPQQGLALLLGKAPVSFRFIAPNQVSLERNAETDAAADLGTSTVVSSADPQEQVFQTPHSVAKITREQIDRHIVRNAADLLEETEGVFSAVSLRDPGLSVNIRGVQDYGRVNMNLDGMRQNYSQMGHQSRNGVIYIDPDLLSGIDIYKGSSSGQGGAGVSGGIATFNTLSVDDILEPGQETGGRIRASNGIGSQANGMHFAGSGVFALRTPVWDALLGYSERHLGNYTAGTRNDGNLSDFIGAQYDGMYAEAGKKWRKDEVQYMDSVQRSYLGKFGLNLPNDQRLQLTMSGTSIGYDDAGWDLANSNSTGQTVYKLNGSNDISSKSTGLDYSWKPDNELIDLKAKLYYVSTRNFQKNAATLTASPSEAHTRTDTYGLQLENTSRFHLGNAGELAWNYGGEFYRDEFKPNNYGDKVGESVTKPYVEGLDPGGHRDMASLFNNLTWDYSDWLTASAGLRYDHYRMSGTTGISTGGAEAGDLGLSYKEFIYDVDDSEGRFSPSLSIGVKPGLDWLQLYASAGRGYRPPTVTEVFTSGRPHGGGSERVYPNPYLKPERSKDYEVGFNIVKDSFLFDGDRLRAKVAYFDTRIDNFTFMNLGTIAPASATGLSSPGNLAYVNNLSTTRFRGIDYKLSYDTGRYYGDLTYTHMIGSNDFCEHPAYLGGVTQIDPSGPTERYVVSTVTLSNGLKIPIYGTRYTYKANDAINNQVVCGNIFGSSAYMPSDRGALTLGSRWFDQTLDIGARLRYSQGQSTDQSEQNTMSLNQAIWPRYKVYDAYLSWWATPQLNLGVLVENLTNEAYLVDMGDNSSLTNLTLARGRTVTGSLEYRF